MNVKYWKSGRYHIPYQKKKKENKQEELQMEKQWKVLIADENREIGRACANLKGIQTHRRLKGARADPPTAAGRGTNGCVHASFRWTCGTEQCPEQ